ncbi:MAG: plasmid mobilization relaxosome protein MobC [Roseobacter sp.]
MRARAEAAGARCDLDARGFGPHRSSPSQAHSPRRSDAGAGRRAHWWQPQPDRAVAEPRDLVGRVDLDALTVARRLLTIERQLAQIVEAARRC